MGARTFRVMPKIFFSPTELGLSTSPTKPTMSAVSSAMPEGSIGIFSTNEVDESEMTANTGLVNVILLFRISDIRQFAFGARSYGNVNLANARLFYGAYNNTNSIWIGWKEFTFAS